MILRLLVLALCFWGCTNSDLKISPLKNELSPYIVKNKKDSIKWYPWGQHPLDLARKNDKLIFLSIGYASCFSCEKMQLDVYQKPMVSKALNEDFISIIVDREERPDLDNYFLNMQSLIMRFGAWPINMILTPDLKPVFATTLMDHGKFLGILNKSSKAWKESREDILKGVKKYENMSEIQDADHLEYEKDEQLIKDFYALYTHNFDSAYGGKGIRKQFNNKFPVNEDLRLLLRYHKKTREVQPLKMVEKTLMTASQSALFDHIDGGFHRYSAARDWNSPNFEKLLMDQASYLHSLADIYSVTKKEFYKRTIEKIIQLVDERMQSPLGGFYNTLSPSMNGKDGELYTWLPNELKNQLGPKEQQLFRSAFQMKPIYRPQLRHKRVLRRKTTHSPNGISELEKKMQEIRDKKGEAKPDSKVVTASNAFLLSAMSKVSRSVEGLNLYQKVKKHLDFIIRQHRSLSGKLYRRSINGQVGHLATLDDYAFLIDALIEFYQLKFEESYLQLARELQFQQNRLFLSKHKGSFLFSQGRESFLQDQFLYIDQSRPNAQSMSYWNLLRLSIYFENIEFENQANQVLNSYPDLLKTNPLSYSHLLLGLDFKLSNPKNVLIFGTTEHCIQAQEKISKGWYPYTLVSCGKKGSELPTLKAKLSNSPQGTYQVCEYRSCAPPSKDFEGLLRAI